MTSNKVACIKLAVWFCACFCWIQKYSLLQVGNKQTKNIPIIRVSWTLLVSIKNLEILDVVLLFIFFLSSLDTGDKVATTLGYLSVLNSKKRQVLTQLGWSTVEPLNASKLTKGRPQWPSRRGESALKCNIFVSIICYVIVYFLMA